MNIVEADTYMITEALRIADELTERYATHHITLTSSQRDVQARVILHVLSEYRANTRSGPIDAQYREECARDAVDKFSDPNELAGAVADLYTYPADII